jgi:hypothetical protein
VILILGVLVGVILGVLVILGVTVGVGDGHIVVVTKTPAEY